MGKEMKKKILVCGSAGFLMSNFMRYMMYRDNQRQYDFASVDCLAEPADIKRVYINRRHSFHIGNVRDKEFMERVMYVEKPDFIVNGVGCAKGEVDIARSVFKSTFSLLESCPENAMVVQVSPRKDMQRIGHEAMDYWDMTSSIVQNKRGANMRIPRSFGFRDRHGMLANVIKAALATEKPQFLSNSKEPMAYAEDVASRIWFIIENAMRGEINMPSLGLVSSEQMYALCNKESGIHDVEYDKDFGCAEKSDDGWAADSESVEHALIKTIKWFNINKWAL